MTGIPGDWYETRSLGGGLTLIRERYVAKWLRCNIWHLRGRDRDIPIDSGTGLRSLKREIRFLSRAPPRRHFQPLPLRPYRRAHEFAERLGHESEAHIHADPSLAATAATGWIMAETFLAKPHEGFDHTRYRLIPAPLTGYLDEGDVVDLGDRVFNVFHLPGHSPGSIGLYEKSTGTLFSGDAVYDGALFDTVYHSRRAVYRESLRRLRELPVSVVYGGHNEVFGRDRMIEIVDAYLAGGRTVGEVSNWIRANG
jgi:hypothetical protein